MKYYHLKVLFFIFLTVTLLQSCFQNYRYLRSYNSGEEPYSLNLKPGTELFLLREDIYRETTTNKTLFSDSTEKTETVNVPYHPMGYHICKGVFLDIHENLAVNIAELFDVTDYKNYEIAEETPTLFGTQHYVVKKEGNEISRIRETLLGDDIDKITLEDGKINIKESGLFSCRQTITVTPGKMSYDSQVLNWLPPVITKENENTYKSKIGFSSDKIEQTDNTHIKFSKYLNITRLDDKIEFNYSFRLPLYLIRLNDGLLFENSNGYLVKIKIDNNKIEVFYNKKLEKTFILNKL